MIETIAAVGAAVAAGTALVTGIQSMSEKKPSEGKQWQQRLANELHSQSHGRSIVEAMEAAEAKSLRKAKKQSKHHAREDQARQIAEFQRLCQLKDQQHEESKLAMVEQLNELKTTNASFQTTLVELIEKQESNLNLIIERQEKSLEMLGDRLCEMTESNERMVTAVVEANTNQVQILTQTIDKLVVQLNNQTTNDT